MGAHANYCKEYGAHVLNVNTSSAGSCSLLQPQSWAPCPKRWDFLCIQVSGCRAMPKCLQHSLTAMLFPAWNYFSQELFEWIRFHLRVAKRKISQHRISGIENMSCNSCISHNSSKVRIFFGKKTCSYQNRSKKFQWIKHHPSITVVSCPTRWSRYFTKYTIV